LCSGLTIFCVDRLQHPVLQQRVGEHLFELTVLSLQFLQALRLVGVHHPKLTLPAVERDFGDVPVLADLDDVFAAVGFPQNADLFLGRVSFAFHDLGSFLRAPD